MKHESITSDNFVSNDGKVGVFIEKNTLGEVKITLAIKNASPRLELNPQQFLQLAEIINAASLVVKPKPLLATEEEE